LIAPARIYEEGVAVDCEGCTIEQHGDEVHITGATGEVVARLKPS
jgi:hypothetical protein